MAKRAQKDVWTACPSGEWADALERLLRGRKNAPYRFVDIGCNKGAGGARYL